MPDNFFIFFEFVTQLLLLFLYSLVKITDEMVEVVLSFDLRFSDLVCVDRTHQFIVVRHFHPFRGVSSFAFEIKFGSIEVDPIFPDRTVLKRHMIMSSPRMMVIVNLLREGV